jgi:hypothetical protein
VTCQDVFVEFLGNEAIFEEYYRAARADDPGPSDLSSDERLALWIYTCADTDWQLRINRELWDGAASDSVTGMETILNAALQKLPRHQGRVYRAFNEPDLDDMLGEYGVGSTVLWFEFASCTTELEAAREGNVLFIVNARHGRLLGPYAGEPGQLEVVFASGSRFRVRALERRKAFAVIELDELDP